MKQILGVKYASPLEREYEAWIVAGIEAYLKNVGLRYAIWAIGSSQEKVWPADEKLSVGWKVVGLQFKRAKLATSGAVGKDRLKWTFDQPAGQLALVSSTPEIFYCLPTFINRDLRSEALHHCLFWRPDPAKLNTNAWYDNGSKKVKTPYKKLDDSMRWGLFFERLMYCNVGKKVRRGGEVDSLTAKLAAFYARNEIPESPDGDLDGEDGTYVLVIERPE
ncbi:hypothetical protein [Stenotrophomonas maltophilia]|uniref:Uncharacterized protein n=1 Tax=Stenotrophomonas maltophilia TaxID=40324 RepID=A0AAP7L234_STEMA|nr:hypothetical protein [Stenotrophomonas maltophilia]KOQ70085.1 hypothetical protein ABW43_06895 [Stenotrophomonas maltophilia]OBU63205.1 hypothetical protein A9K56_00365 [Stenotrophomonas maltophilia]